jgi:hypothetical protein
MTHTYTSAHYDGKHYHYTCECGHIVKTIDGKLPVKIGLGVKND